MTCDRCGTELLVGMFPFCRNNPKDHGTVYSKSLVFPFEARHVTPDGKPLIIDSIKHLRDVERTYGVAFSVFNNNHNNSVDPLQGNLPRYRGEDPDFGRR